MQRCYHRLAGNHRLACFGVTYQHGLGALFSTTYHHGSRSCFSTTTTRWAATGHKYAPGDPGYLPDSKLPPRSERGDPDAWVRLLSPVLPPRLRPSDFVAKPEEEEALSPFTPRDVAIAVWRAKNYRAQNGPPTQQDSLDILTYMGVEKGQWKAVTWLLSRIIDQIWEGGTHIHNPKLPGPWNMAESLHGITEIAGIELQVPDDPLINRPTLDSLTQRSSSTGNHQQRSFNQELLGVVWTSLGNMIIADAARASQSDDKAITPEILEIIALFHHHGIMPSSIYSYEPSDDDNARRQPPTLHLLSSHILTSLSDAAWRAHESLVVEEAKSKGGEYLSLRPEIPGSMYRVRVAGLSHEIWLELVLWSCLHGGWVEEGASVLRQVSRHESWSALSWREVAGSLTGSGEENSTNWAGTKNQSSEIRVQRTVSIEVITAFVHALLDGIRGRVATRGIAAARVWQSIGQFKSFLEKRDLSLGVTSWDVVVYRFIESEGMDTSEDPTLTARVVQGASEFGKELSAINSPARGQNSQPLSTYFLDGTAASMGLMHRVLQSNIQAGDVGAASRTFKMLQTMTDKNKRESIEAFFKKRSQQVNEDNDTGEFNFESRLYGIEYPGFHPQLPVTILAPLLDLITDTGSLDFGKLLLQTEALDEPIISKAMWGDPILGPAILRFASALDDEALVSKVLAKQSEGRGRGLRLPIGSLLALLEGQVRLKQWGAMETVLRKLVETGLETELSLEDDTFDGRNGVVGTLACALVQEVDADAGPSFNTASANTAAAKRKNVKEINAFDRIWRLFLELFKLNQTSENVVKMRSVLLILASVDRKWERHIMALPGLTQNLIQQRSGISPFTLHRIIRSVTAKYGAKHGIEFLGKFYRAARDESMVVPSEASEEVSEDASTVNESGGIKPMPARRPGDILSQQPTFFSLRLSQAAKGSAKGVGFWGTYKPTVAVTSSILEQGLSECGKNMERREWYVAWARRMMGLMGERGEAVDEEIARVSSRVVYLKAEDVQASP